MEPTRDTAIQTARFLKRIVSPPCKKEIVEPPHYTLIWHRRPRRGAVSNAHSRVGCAIRLSLPLCPLRRGDDGLGGSHVLWEYHDILAALDLRDQHHMLVLTVSIKLDRTESSGFQVDALESVAHLGRVQRLGVVHGLSRGHQ